MMGSVHSYDLRSRTGDNDGSWSANLAKKEQNQHGKGSGGEERTEINCLSAGTERGQWTH